MKSGSIVDVANELLKKETRFREKSGVEEEMQEIKVRAEQDGTFMKAPNGKSTNLNERQWLQVRKGAFKEWFGDLEIESENKVSKEKIEQLLKADKDTSKGIQRETISNITPEQAKTLEDVLGIDTEGFKHTIDKSSIQHIVRKHGNSKTEESRGQIAVTESDFLKIPEVLNNPGKVEYSGKNDKGLDTIKYTKAFNGTTIIVEEVRTGRKELALNTMYKRKTKNVGEFMHSEKQNPYSDVRNELPQDKDTKTMEFPK